MSLFVLGPRVYFAEKPLREAHHETLRRTQSRAENRQQQASWANKGVAVVLAKIFANMSDRWVMNRLSFDETPCSEKEKSEKKKDGKLFFDLLVHMVSQRGWSCAPQWVSQPDNWLGILDSDKALAGQALKQIKEDAAIVMAAVTLCDAKDESVDFEVRSVCFNQLFTWDSYIIDYRVNFEGSLQLL